MHIIVRVNSDNGFGKHDFIIPETTAKLIVARLHKLIKKGSIENENLLAWLNALSQVANDMTMENSVLLYEHPDDHESIALLISLLKKILNEASKDSCTDVIPVLDVLIQNLSEVNKSDSSREICLYCEGEAILCLPNKKMNHLLRYGSSNLTTMPLERETIWYIQQCKNYFPLPELFHFDYFFKKNQVASKSYKSLKGNKNITLEIKR